MADYHQIVEQIRMALHAGDPGQNGRLAGLASAYADACAEAALRLGRCHRLLQQGLRSEAIQLAESEPKLLDMLAVLDFPERPEWDDMVQMRDLPPAPRIPLEPARLLNEAYAEEDPLQDLLRRHRRLALQRAALRLRIAVLRQLAAQDPGSPIWADDIRAFEQFRLLEIQDEATEALKHQDPEWIGRLVSEVEQPGWSEPPPRALVLSLHKADGQLRAGRARAALEDVAARLDEACNARDPIRGRLARHEWSRLATAAALEPDDPFADRARPALEWLDEQDRRDRENREHEAALGNLVRALDYPGSLAPAELERLAHAVQVRGDGLPEGLRQRYITRLRTAESAQARRRRLIAAGSAAGVILVSALIYFAVHAQARSREAEQAATSIGDMLELGELDHAIALVKKLEASDPDLMRYPALVQVRERVEIEQGKESDRAVRFDQAMREAEAAPASAKPPPALQTARSLARLDTEKGALEDLVRRRAAILQAEAGRRDKELSPRLDEIARALDRIEQQLGPDGPGRPDNPAILGSIADSQRALSGLTSEVAMAGAGLQDRARVLNTRLDLVRSKMEKRGQQARLEGAITAAVAYSPDGRAFTASAELASALQAFSKAFPDSPRSRAFAITLRDQPVWDAIADWDRRTTGWRDGRTAVAPQEASVRVEQCRQFLVQHPASPDFERATAYQHAMEAMSHRAADAEGALGKLQKLMTDLLVDNLWMVTIRAPAAEGLQNYYVTEQPPRHPKSLRYLVGFDGKERTLKVVGDWVERIEVSPQTKIANKFKPLLFQDPTQIDWEVVILDLIDQVRNQPGMDPVLRVALLRKILELGLEGSEPLQTALGGLKNQVDQADVDVNVPWMDPESREADQVRPKASAFIRSLPDLTALRKNVLARQSAVRRLMASRAEAVGWLAREPEGWQVRSGAVLPSLGTLRIALMGDDGHGTWKKIGIIDQGRARLTAADDPALAEGRPVFVGAADVGSSPEK
jgi:hypothetical protein